MNSFTLVHPNNRLTRMNNLTIPNVQKYRKVLESQIHQIEHLNDTPKSDGPTTSTKAPVSFDAARIKRLSSFKKAELRYVDCYLCILSNLESVCKSCQLEDSSYDYEKEDEILNRIEDKMKELRCLEKALSKSKTLFETDGSSCKQNEDLSDEQRRPSLLEFEKGLFESVSRLQI